MSTTVASPPAALEGKDAYVPSRRPDATRRINGIDHLRGFVCLCITVGHLYADGLGTAVARSRPGTECFMVLSGFMLARVLKPASKPVAFGRLVRRRVLRLAVPYAVALTVAAFSLPLIAAVGRRLGYPNHILFPNLDGLLTSYLPALACVTDLTGGVWPGPLWSMIVLIQATVLLCGAFWMTRWVFALVGADADRAAYTAVSAAVAVGFVVSAPQTLHRDLGSWWLVWNFGYLAAGWLLAAVDPPWAGWVAVAVGGGLATVSIHALTAAPLGVHAAPVRPILAAATVAALWALMRHGERALPAALDGLRVVGRRSYSVYLTHMTAGMPVLLALRQVWPESATGWPQAVAAVVALTAAAATAEVFYRLVELPLGRLADGPRPTPAPAPDTIRLVAPDTARLATRGRGLSAADGAGGAGSTSARG